MSSFEDTGVKHAVEQTQTHSRRSVVRMRILLVDDSSDSCSIIADWLNEFFGAVFIESAASGGEALDAIERRCPELVLATHPMPIVSAIELARVIKGRPNPPVVVVINAGSDTELEGKCAAAGADFCVEKRQLQARLLGFLQQRFAKAWAEGVAARRISAYLEQDRAHRIQRRVAERRLRIGAPA
jgi:CheY-like chemotaxis protein